MLQAVQAEIEGTMAFLTEPDERYRTSYLAALREFQAEGRLRETSFEEVSAHFDRFVESLRAQADRSKLKPDLVPSSDFWLIDEDVFIGRLSLRHELNERLLQMGGHIGYAIRPTCRKQGYGRLILQYGLEQQARTLRLECVLVTCDDDNTASRRIIESNGGVLENIVQVEWWPAKLRRYWIELK
jgi:predicted acetyltransferase